MNKILNISFSLIYLLFLCSCLRPDEDLLPTNEPTPKTIVSPSAIATDVPLTDISPLSISTSSSTNTLTPDLLPTQTSTMTIMPSEIAISTFTPLLNAITLSGVWDFQTYTRKKVGSDGFIKDTSEIFYLVVRLEQTEENLQGEIVGAKTSSNQKACKGTLIGTVQGIIVNFTIHYESSCCPHDPAKFSGSMGSDGRSLIGEIEPVNDIPSPNCTFYYSDVTATKR